MSKDCPTCHRPFEKRGMHCASCGRPIKKNHKWRIDHSTVRHQDCRNVRLVPLCQSRFSTQECVLELENHPTRHISVTGVTWSLDEHEFDRPFMSLSYLDESGQVLAEATPWVVIEQEVSVDVLRSIYPTHETLVSTAEAIESAENEGMILRERGE